MAKPADLIRGPFCFRGFDDLGGAVATHLRSESPVFTHLLLGVYLGIAIWAGLSLRDPRVRAMIPFQK